LATILPAAGCKYITNDFSRYLAGMKLFFRSSGQGTPLIILHGLFGSSDNWHTLAKTFALTHSVFALDQRNHGQSPHSDDFNYRLLTEDLFEFVQEHKLQDVNIIGHSMGGKTAMNFAIRYPDLTRKLIVVDIVPKTYVMRHDNILEGMKALPLETLKSRDEAESILVPFVPDTGERQFIMKNLQRLPSGGFEWKVNLKALDEHMPDLGVAMEYPGTFNKPTLFVKGARSSYFKEGDENIIRTYFPNALFRTLDTGHWVQAEKPAEFAEVALSFFNS
jgi:esterase